MAPVDENGFLSEASGIISEASMLVIGIGDRPSEDTLIIEWNYGGESEAAEKSRESRSYLCDKDGRILKTDWYYDQVDYVEADGVIDRGYLVFHLWRDGGSMSFWMRGKISLRSNKKHIDI